MISYYDNGQIWEKSMYINGKIYGDTKHYYENGQLVIYEMDNYYEIL
jgi:antitoxin component YwqK of YwqJK toxin-antitoxin module